MDNFGAGIDGCVDDEVWLKPEKEVLVLGMLSTDRRKERLPYAEN